MLRRREFIQRAAVATALLGISEARAEEAFARGPDALPPLKLLDTDPERYWAELRRQWLLPPIGSTLTVAPSAAHPCRYSAP